MNTNKTPKEIEKKKLSFSESLVNYYNITVLKMSSNDNKPLFSQLRIGIQLIFGHKRLKYYHYLIKYWFYIFNRRQGK